MENATNEEQLKKLLILKEEAVRQAMFEVVGENRAEIVKRAMAKLAAMGVTVTDVDLGGS